MLIYNQQRHRNNTNNMFDNVKIAYEFALDYDLNTFSFIDYNKETSEENWVDIVTSSTGFKNHKIKINQNT